MRLNNEVFVPIEEIRVEFEKRNAVPDYAFYDSSTDTYRWSKFRGVGCPDINDKWESFCEGWHARHEYDQLQSKTQVLE